MAPIPSEKEKQSGEPKQRRRPGRVPVSCAECRRLKLRCDRKVPCETCVKRGCSAICPEGSLITGKANRLSLADAEELHTKLERSQKRISDLETALRTLQAAVVDEPHPLLLDNTMNATPSSERSNSTPDGGPLLSQEDEEVLDAFGTLTLGMRGESRFFGQTARSEFLIHAPTVEFNRKRKVDTDIFRGLSKSVITAALHEIDLPCSDVDIRRELLGCLPTLGQACRLCEMFLEHGQYIWYPVPRTQLFDELLQLVYRDLSIDEEWNPSSAHAVSLLFMVFALAVLFDPDRPPYAVEGQEYYLLARVALRFAPPTHETTLVAIQSMIYMAQFLEMGDCEPAHTGSNKAWIILGHAVKLGLGIGLHLSGNKWKLDEDASDQRSRVFWQLFEQDTWISFGFGRPPSLSLEYVDCKFPKDPEERIDEHGNKYWSFHAWTLQYTKLLHTVIGTAFGANVPQYSTIIELDRRIRDFPVPFQLRAKCGMIEDPPPTTAVRLQRWFAMSCKESTLLSLHRAYFAQALKEQPADLLRHRYGPSVMAIYRSAWRLTEGARDSFKHSPRIVSRIGIIWSQSLAAAIVMCLLVTRTPSTTLTTSALQQLDRLCELFEDAKDICQVACNNIEVVRKLRRQSHESTNNMYHQDQNRITFTELGRFGGETRLISSTCRPAQLDPQPQHYSTVSTSDPMNMEPVLTEFIHPTIINDLRAFEGPLQDLLNNAQYNLDFPSQTFPSTMMDYSSGIGLAPTIDFSALATVPESEPLPPGFTTLEAGGPPVLDETWQSFIEQLGF